MSTRDTTKQRLLDTGLFTEGGSVEDHGAYLIINGQGVVCGGELPIFARTILRFNALGELTSVSMRISEQAVK